MVSTVVFATLALTGCDPVETVQQVQESDNLLDLMVECADIALAAEPAAERNVAELRAAGEGDLDVADLTRLGVAFCVEGESDGEWRCVPAPPPAIPSTCYTSGRSVQAGVEIDDAIEQAREQRASR